MEKSRDNYTTRTFEKKKQIITYIDEGHSKKSAKRHFTIKSTKTIRDYYK